MRATIDVLLGQVEHGLKGVLRAGLLLKMEKEGAEAGVEKVKEGARACSGRLSPTCRDPAKNAICQFS
jgi:hypothetical protein